MPCFFLSTALIAQEPQESLHDGFFGQFYGGYGYGEIYNFRDELSGFGFFRSIGLRFGWAASQNLILHLSLFHSGTAKDIESRDPERNFPGQSFSYYVQGAGIGLSYYFTPSNIYISFLSGRGKGELSGFRGKGKLIPLNENEREVYFTLDNSIISLTRNELAIGKEFWLSPDWSWGIAVLCIVGEIEKIHYYKEIESRKFLFSSRPSTQTSYFWFGVGATVTYN